MEFQNCMLFQAIHSCYGVFPHLRFEFHWTVSHFALLQSLSIQINAALKLSELKLLNSATEFRIVMIYSGFFFLLVSCFFHSHFQLVKRNAKKYSRYLNSFNGTCKKFLFRPSRFHAIRVFVTFVEQL